MTTNSKIQQLPKQAYLQFPFRIGQGGAVTSSRAEHVREQIEQILFTNPRERVFRPQYGAGAMALTFEPNATPLWEITRKRLTAALVEALAGEADPRSIHVDVSGTESQLEIEISYKLAALDQKEQHRFSITSGS